MFKITYLILPVQVHALYFPKCQEVFHSLYKNGSSPNWLGESGPGFEDAPMIHYLSSPGFSSHIFSGCHNNALELALKVIPIPCNQG